MSAAQDEDRPVAAQSSDADESTAPAGVAAAAEEAGAAGAAVEAAAALDPAPDAPDPAPTELETMRKERTELAERLLRTAADFDNFRKRTRREVEDAKLRGRDEAIRDFLPVFDNLERAVQASATASDATAVVEGVRMVLKLFEDTAQRMGLDRIPSVGERFDPAVHEAIQQQETNDHPAGTIVAEVAPGYAFGKRLLRAAMVVVARRASEAKGTPEAVPVEAADAATRAPDNADDAQAAPAVVSAEGEATETDDEADAAPEEASS